MADHPNQPQEYDAVLGGKNPIPDGSAILGGIEGVKKRLDSAIEEQRIAALSEALKYGEAGLDLLIRALQDESTEVEKTAYLLLKERTELKVKQALEAYNPWEFVKCLRTVKGPADWIKFVGFSLDGQTLLSVNEECYSRWRETNFYAASSHISKVAWISKFRIFRYSNLTCAAISLDGQTLVNGNDGEINIRHLQAENGIRILDGHSNYVNSIAISQDGQTIVSGGEDKTLKVWHLETGELIRTIEGHSEEVTAAAISLDGQTIVSGSYDDTIKLWNLETGELIRTLSDDSGYATSIAISPDGKTLVSGYDYGSLKIWHLPTGELIKTIQAHSNEVTSISISLDGKMMVSGSYDNTIKIWEVR